MQVGYNFTECALPSIGFGMLGTSEPAEEVSRLVVESVGDKMVTYTRLSVGWVGWTVAIESKRHKKVARFSSCLSFGRISATMCVSGFNVSVRGRKCFLYFLSFRIEEIAVGVSPADDAAGVVEWYLFASLG